METPPLLLQMGGMSASTAMLWSRSLRPEVWAALELHQSLEASPQEANPEGKVGERPGPTTAGMIDLALAARALRQVREAAKVALATPDNLSNTRISSYRRTEKAMPAVETGEIDSEVALAMTKAVLEEGIESSRGEVASGPTTCEALP